MNGESEDNMTIENSSSICDHQIVIVYQVNNVVAGPIYNESHKVYDTLKFDICENSDIVSDQIFDTHLNKGIDDTIDLDVIQDYQDTPNFNEYQHVEF